MIIFSINHQIKSSKIFNNNNSFRINDEEINKIKLRLAWSEQGQDKKNFYTLNDNQIYDKDSREGKSDI